MWFLIFSWLCLSLRVSSQDSSEPECQQDCRWGASRGTRYYWTPTAITTASQAATVYVTIDSIAGTTDYSTAYAYSTFLDGSYRSSTISTDAGGTQIKDITYHDRGNTASLTL